MSVRGAVEDKVSLCFDLWNQILTGHRCCTIYNIYYILYVEQLFAEGKLNSGE